MLCAFVLTCLALLLWWHQSCVGTIGFSVGWKMIQSWNSVSPSCLGAVGLCPFSKVPVSTCPVIWLPPGFLPGDVHPYLLPDKEFSKPLKLVSINHSQIEETNVPIEWVSRKSGVFEAPLQWPLLGGLLGCRSKAIQACPTLLSDYQRESLNVNSLL